MGNWLECIISPGQFTGEFAVQGKMFDSTDFSLFAPKEDLQFSEKVPARGKHVFNVSCSSSTDIRKW